MLVELLNNRGGQGDSAQEKHGDEGDPVNCREKINLRHGLCDDRLQCDGCQEHSKCKAKPRCQSSALFGIRGQSQKAHCCENIERSEGFEKVKMRRPLEPKLYTQVRKFEPSRILLWFLEDDLLSQKCELGYLSVEKHTKEITLGWT